MLNDCYLHIFEASQLVARIVSQAFIRSNDSRAHLFASRLRICHVSAAAVSQL